MQQKLQLEYPCKWIYKVIGTNKEEMQKAISEILEHEHQILPSKSSLSGKYHSLEIRTEVKNEEERHQIFFKLKNCKCIKFIL